jgi:glyoxylase-like metal-dependent hydrolase (beta-lactamase superfamily II)
MLVDGAWLPTFPNARYFMAETEWRYWDANEDEAEYGPVLADSVRPVFDAGLVDLVDAEHQLCDEVWLEPTPGHTPGHVSVRISSGGENALITVTRTALRRLRTVSPTPGCPGGVPVGA